MLILNPKSKPFWIGMIVRSRVIWNRQTSRFACANDHIDTIMMIEVVRSRRLLNGSRVFQSIAQTNKSDMISFRDTKVDIRFRIAKGSKRRT